MRNARALLLLGMCFALPRRLTGLEDAPASARAREHYMIRPWADSRSAATFDFYTGVDASGLVAVAVVVVAVAVLTRGGLTLRSGAR